MTIAKGEDRVSEKRVYSHGGQSIRGKKPHSALNTIEIRDLFVGAGWLGRPRERPALIRAVPYFDRGPGIGR